MPRLLRKDSDGSRWVQEDDGSLREATATDLGNVAPSGIANEMGVELHERILLKSLATNPQSARDWLHGRGYYTLPYGSGLNFAVQKGQLDENGNWLPPDPSQWKVIDPSGGKDFFNDICRAPAGALQISLLSLVTRLLVEQRHLPLVRLGREPLDLGALLLLLVQPQRASLRVRLLVRRQVSKTIFLQLRLAQLAQSPQPFQLSVGVFLEVFPAWRVAQVVSRREWGKTFFPSWSRS